MTYFSDLRHCGIAHNGRPLVAASAELCALLGPNPLDQLKQILTDSYELSGTNPPRRIGTLTRIDERGVTRVKVECQLRRDGWGLLVAPAERCHGTTERHGSTRESDTPQDRQSGEAMTNPGKSSGELAAGIRVVLAAIDAGEIEATDVQRAYLAGAADALDTLAVRSSPLPSVHDTDV